MMIHDRVQELEKIPEDEPIFILRAQDRLAPWVINAWAGMALARGAPEEKVRSAQRCADDMRRWAEGHSSKVPD